MGVIAADGYPTQLHDVRHRLRFGIIHGQNVAVMESRVACQVLMKGLIVACVHASVWQWRSAVH